MVLAAILIMAGGDGAALADDARPGADDVITVRVGRIERDLRDVTAPVSVLTEEDIARLQGADLGDLLTALPGVTAEGGERAEALQPNIRGLGESRVVSRIDGARQNIALSHRGRSFIDPALIGRVEVLRGPGSTLYGSGAVGGVVEIETLDPDQLAAPGAGPAYRLALRGADNASRLGGTLAAAVQGERFGALAAISASRSDDYTDGDGVAIPFSDTDQTGALLKASAEDIAGGELSASYAGYREAGLSLLTADRAEGDPVDRETRQDVFSARYRRSGDGLWAPEVTVYAVETVFDEALVDSPETRSNALTTLGLDAVNVSRFQLAGRQTTVVAGVEVYNDDQTGTRNGAPNPGFASSSLTTAGVFALGETALSERLTVIAGVRADAITLQAERDGLADADLDALSPNLAFTYALSDTLTARASYAEAFRAPSLRQLFVGGPHFPGNDYVPNPDLQPETARNLEAGLIWRAPALDGELSGEVFVFKNQIDDFIEQVVASTTTSFLNVGEAEIDGVEARLSYAGDRLRTSLTVQLLDGDNLERAEPLQSIPADELSLQVVRLMPAWNLEAGARLIATAAQDDVPDRPFTIVATDAHQRLDLFARWRAPGTRAVVRVGVDNITDETYRRHLSQINAPGRRFKLSLTADF